MQLPPVSLGDSTPPVPQTLQSPMANLMSITETLPPGSPRNGSSPPNGPPPPRTASRGSQHSPNSSGKATTKQTKENNRHRDYERRVFFVPFKRYDDATDALWKIINLFERDTEGEFYYWLWMEKYFVWLEMFVWTIWLVFIIKLMYCIEIWFDFSFWFNFVISASLNAIHNPLVHKTRLAFCIPFVHSSLSVDILIFSFEHSF